MSDKLGMDAARDGENPFDGVEPEHVQVQQAAAQPIVQQVETDITLPEYTIGVEVAQMQAEMQSMVFLARKFPRNREKARRAILDAAKVYLFAEKARYSFPRGKGNTVTGISIRGVEEMGRNWGNLHSGTRILSTDMVEGISHAIAFCWDLETNYRDEKRFPVEHVIDLKYGKTKRLTASRDVYEWVQNQAQRRKRACILNHIPYDIQVDFLAECRGAIASGPSGKTFKQYIDLMIERLTSVHVTVAMIEKKIGHSVTECDRDEMVTLQDIYNAIKDDPRLRAKHFDLAGGSETAKVMEALDD